MLHDYYTSRLFYELLHVAGSVDHEKASQYLSCQDDHRWLVIGKKMKKPLISVSRRRGICGNCGYLVRYSPGEFLDIGSVLFVAQGIGIELQNLQRDL